jgi:hypothetical protein
MSDPQMQGDGQMSGGDTGAMGSSSREDDGAQPMQSEDAAGRRRGRVEPGHPGPG